jgi:hypothetical protein
MPEVYLGDGLSANSSLERCPHSLDAQVATYVSLKIPSVWNTDGG